MAGGLYRQFIKRLDECEKRGSFIPWNTVYSRMCSIFCLSKNETREILHSLADAGVVEFVPEKGVRLVRKDGWSLQEEWQSGTKN